MDLLLTIINCFAKYTFWFVKYEILTKSCFDVFWSQRIIRIFNNIILAKRNYGG